MLFVTSENRTKITSDRWVPVLALSGATAPGGAAVAVCADRCSGVPRGGSVFAQSRLQSGLPSDRVLRIAKCRRGHASLSVPKRSRSSWTIRHQRGEPRWAFRPGRRTSKTIGAAGPAIASCDPKARQIAAPNSTEHQRATQEIHFVEHFRPPSDCELGIRNAPPSSCSFTLSLAPAISDSSASSRPSILAKHARQRQPLWRQPRPLGFRRLASGVKTNLQAAQVASEVPSCHQT